jgi:hypothetical protein
MMKLDEAITRRTLSALPAPTRTLFTCFLLTIGIGYAAALFYLFLVDVDPHQKVGIGIAEGIARKYHGARSKTRLESALRGPMSDRLEEPDKQEILRWLHDGASEDGFAEVQPIFEKICMNCHKPATGLPIPPLTGFEDIRKVAQVDMGLSFLQLARVSHVHLFGMSIIFLLTGGIFAFSAVSAKLRLLIIAVPYVSIWADVGSWWIMKYQPDFAYAVLIGGALMGVSLAAQILISIWEMWFTGSAAPPATHSEVS